MPVAPLASRLAGHPILQYLLRDFHIAKRKPLPTNFLIYLMPLPCDQHHIPLARTVYRLINRRCSVFLDKMVGIST